jgi:hypothetical protein
LGVLQGFALPVEVGLTTLEGGLVGAQDLELTTECDVVQLFLLQQPPSLSCSCPSSSSTSRACWLT